jgi:hypothetical protein
MRERDMIEGIYDARNEITHFDIFTEIGDRRSTVASFLRRAGYPHLFVELIEPLFAQGSLLAIAGVVDRPWPPSGIGSTVIDALGLALIGEGGRAFLTPPLTTISNSTNVGLLATVVRELLRELVNRKTEFAILLVNEKSSLIRQILSELGFRPTGEQVVTEKAAYLHFATGPEELLNNLGIAGVRTGDLLAHRLEASILSRLALFHLALGRALETALSESDFASEILPGLVDWVATLPPGGIGGTPGPKVDPVLDEEAT